MPAPSHQQPFILSCDGTCIATTPHPNSVADSASALTHGDARKAFYKYADRNGLHHLTYEDHLRLGERSPV